MKVIASTDEYTIYQRRDGRYAVKAAGNKAVNGDDKVAILRQHELIAAPAPKAPEPEAVDEPEVADAEGETAETQAEADAAEAPAADAPAAEEPAADDAEEPAAG